MELTQFAVHLKNLLNGGNCIFVRLEPEIIDFTDVDCVFNLVFCSKDYEFKLEVDLEKQSLSLCGYLGMIFENENLVIISWNIKNLFSYLLAKTRSHFSYSCHLLDLKILEVFLGINDRCPSDFEEALARIKSAARDEVWNETKFIYKKIHLPLITRVVPLLETQGLLDSRDRLIRYSYYEIEGQTGGRMACQKVLNSSFNPHSIRPEERDAFQPKASVSSTFVYFDYKHNEVSMLYWLTKDNKLGELLDTDDFYVSLFKIIAGVDNVNESQRTFCKNLFLPLIYGQSYFSLAKSLGISNELARKLVEKIAGLFPNVFYWMNENSKNDICYDYFKRRRAFEDKRWKIRNFLVQSPASIVCLEKLIELSTTIRGYGDLIAHIHDGYLLRANDSLVENLCSIIKGVLESESELCPGLRLRTTHKCGKTLASLENLEN